MEVAASKDTYIASDRNDSVLSGSRRAQKVGRSAPLPAPVCQAICKSSERAVMQRLSLWKGVGVCELRAEENNVSKNVEARSRAGHWERSAHSSNPMVTLDHVLTGGRTFPPSG